MIKRTVALAHAPDADTTKLTLLDRIGGPPAVRLLVERLMEAITSDPFLARRVEGLDLMRLRRAQTWFFEAAFGGGDSPGGADAAVIRVDGEALVRIVVHLHDALDSLGLPAPLCEQLLLAAAAKVLGDEHRRSASAGT